MTETMLETDKTSEINWKEREIDVDLSRARFTLDALQEELLKKYLRNDRSFLVAWNTNYTPLFIQYLKDKCRLNEPVTISIIGQTRGGKSTSGITIAGLLVEARGRLMDVDHVCANEFIFLEELKKAKFGDAYVIDESKHAVFGTGSMAKRFKIQDVQNIIAVNNISTIWITPDKFSFEGANYGLRAFGRAQFYSDGTRMPVRLNRFMLYNLQESSAGGSVPLGMVYLPHFQDILENGDELWKAYSEKKQGWVDQEVQGTQDALINQVFKVAENIHGMEKYKLLKTKSEKLTFISALMGNEATRGECQQILDCLSLLDKGFTMQEIKDMNKVG